MPRCCVKPNQAVRHLGVAAVSVEGSKDIEDTFQQIIEEHIDAVDMLVSPEFFRIRPKIAELGLKYRLPIIGGEDGFAQFGGLINYGPSLIGNWRQAAVYVDKILKGEKPADQIPNIALTAVSKPLIIAPITPFSASSN